MILKDDGLFLLKSKGMNIADFISFRPKLLKGEMLPIPYNTDEIVETIEDPTILKNKIQALIEDLIKRSPEGRINIRRFSEKEMSSPYLVYSQYMKDLNEVINEVYKNALEGYISIVNETVDVNDGGVSGVILNNRLEFSPEDTPKCVDKPGITSLPLDIGLEMLKKIYRIDLLKELGEIKPQMRIEFSIHPVKRGYKKTHCLTWQFNEIESLPIEESDYLGLTWPNNMSKYVGDKTFGLLLADCLGLNVPETVAITNNLAPFIFGQDTGEIKRWCRTAPSVKSAGEFYTGDWVNPFDLRNTIEEANKNNTSLLGAILSCQEVDSEYSGACIFKSSGELIIEGVKGYGTKFMVGEESPINLPEEVIEAIKSLVVESQIYKKLGTFSMEWGIDKNGKIWVFQLNQLEGTNEDIEECNIISTVASTEIIPVLVNNSLQTIVEGAPTIWEAINIKEFSLDDFRKLVIDTAKEGDKGLVLRGKIGITSHYGDILRQYKVPSKLNTKKG